MAKTKVSEWSATPANNTDVGGIDINEGCAPSGINNAIRDMMSQIKDMQTGADGDNFAVSGTLAITGGFTLDGAAGTSGQVMVSAGSGNTPTWGAGFVSGMIMLWSGSIASVPSGWGLCDGSSGTPDLRNRFVVGAFADDSGVAKAKLTQSIVSAGSFVSGTSYVIQTLGTTNFTLIGASSNTVGLTFTATGIGSGTGTAITSDTVYTQSGGSKDSIVVAHTHTGTTNTVGNHQHTTALGDDLQYSEWGSTGSIKVISGVSNTIGRGALTSPAGSHNHSFTTASTGSSGTNANLPPYFALAYIIKL